MKNSENTEYYEDTKLNYRTVSQCITSDYCRGYNEAVKEANNIIRDLKEKTINEFVEQFEELVGDSFLCANSVVGKAFDIVKDRMINGESEGV